MLGNRTELQCCRQQFWESGHCRRQHDHFVGWQEHHCKGPQSRSRQSQSVHFLSHYGKNLSLDHKLAHYLRCTLQYKSRILRSGIDNKGIKLQKCSCRLQIGHFRLITLIYFLTVGNVCLLHTNIVWPTILFDNIWPHRHLAVVALDCCSGGRN